jgi:hypothetical protein
MDKHPGLDALPWAYAPPIGSPCQHPFSSAVVMGPSALEQSAVSRRLWTACDHQWQDNPRPHWRRPHLLS